ncbi:hypothetical protein JRQ81_005659 [Phrynocephalus forsythii]|uniref:Apolipoprotein B receptor n=1 Tax=Phrynocephalus forsythii TaxID=171643 RepID=A0A9Q0XH33_9SAUR|nr:hypothetical protein JRQ81_005659 [Phrynocephalus forsythii]
MVTTTVTGSIKGTDLVESTPPQEIHPWDAGVPEKEVQEELADAKWDLARPLAGGKQHGEMSGEGWINAGQETELKENLWNEEVQPETSNLAVFLQEPWRKQGKMTQTGRFEHQEVGKTMKDLQLESEKDHEEESIKEQSNITVGKEDTLQAMMDNVETLGDKAGALEEENKMGRTHQWKPKGKPEEAVDASKGEGRELGDVLCNTGVQARSDLVSFVEECHGEAERAVWMEGVQYGGLEVPNEMVGGQEDEPEKVGKEVLVEATEDQQGEPDILAMKEGSEQTMLGRAETQEELEGEDKPWKRSNLWEPNEESEEVQEASRWENNLEGSSWKEGVQEDAVDWAQVAEEQHGSLQKAAWTERFQGEGLERTAKEVESLTLEAEKMQGEIVEVDRGQQGQPNIVAEKEEHRQAMLHGAEIEEGAEVELEGEKRLAGTISGMYKMREEP